MKKLLLAALLGAVTATAAAQQSDTPATFPVIVVFKENAPVNAYRGHFRRDARASARPDAWAYVDAGIGGAVNFLEKRHGFLARHVYSAALAGFAARLTAAQIAELENDDLVEFVEPDGVMTASAQTLPWGINRVDADSSSTAAGNGAGAVSNVNIYVIDTGVAPHADLYRVNHVTLIGGTNTDCQGHGTHVAGSIAARDNTSDVVGVAPGAPITGVKVLDCAGSGTTSGVIKGIDWVTANAKKPAVANMSLGGGASQALDDAVKRSVAKGIFYAVAAGNSGVDACTQSPARLGTMNGVMTIGAIDSANNDPSWSNFGACVDIWAPGVSILSTNFAGGTVTMSGTSMASPHAAGAAALFLSTHTTLSPALVEAQLKADAVATGTFSNANQPIKRIDTRGY